MNILTTPLRYYIILSIAVLTFLVSAPIIAYAITPIGTVWGQHPSTGSKFYYYRYNSGASINIGSLFIMIDTE